MKKQLFYASLFAGLVMLACNKKETPCPQPASPAQAQPVKTGMTLKHFGDTRTIDKEKKFLTTTQITDNTSFYPEISSTGKTTSYASRPRFSFKWHGSGNSCEEFPGICVIIPLGIYADPSLDPIQVGLNMNSNGQMVISFPPDVDSNFGLTDDGYLPLYSNVSIPNSVAAELGLSSGNHFIKTGIYKANYDSTTERYTGVVVDIN